jgi:threonine dehydratase
MKLPNKSDIESAASTVYQYMSSTPLYDWPLLRKRCGVNVFVKHENHTPTGAFKIRGGLTYMSWLRSRYPTSEGVIAATTGNHGQSVALAALKNGLSAVIIVPENNSNIKNKSMISFGAELITYGHDFQAAYEYALNTAEERNLSIVPSFSEYLISGVSTYGLEIFQAQPDLDSLYVPIGLGSGICGCIAAREAFGLKTKIIGVVAENAACYSLSFNQKKPVSTNSANTIADGLACRIPDSDAVRIINKYVDRVVQVNENEIKGAMGYYFTDTHNIAEGAGAAPLAALIKERNRYQNKNVGVVLTGGNLDLKLYCEVLKNNY